MAEEERDTSPEAEVSEEQEMEAVEEAAAEADEPTEDVETEAPAAGAEAEVEEPAAEAEEEPAAEAAADEPAAEAEVEAPAAAAEPGAEEAAAPAEPARKPKKKRLPRALRPQRTKPKREKPKERRPIVRLPKPEHARGRRQERQGVVVSAAMDKTIVVRVDTVKMHPRYKKVIRRSTKLHAHDESNRAKIGDVVRIVETRPLSRLKRWRLSDVVQEAK
jgi:small subunit ribosomal protein S17